MSREKRKKTCVTLVYRAKRSRGSCDSRRFPRRRQFALFIALHRRYRLSPPPLPFESPFVRPSWALEINFPLCTPRAIVSAVKATAAARGGLAARAHARSSEFIPGIHHREIPSASPTAKLYATKSRLADFPSAGAASPPRCSRSRVLALRSSRPSHARRGCVPSPLTPTPSPPPQPARTSPGATWSF